ncbi:PQQ-dependent sugar dehydrogenase [Luteolibacter marinus]|uniref:PQQ-dependent sugar dehydrogenase n=1 Tax=Luteolibacter marinus TaxID=2776705 RepID=UPI001867F1FF|nr:PQQ-dependent sugar dehydrogenase [Luteolibacter marinus]
MFPHLVLSALISAVGSPAPAKTPGLDFAEAVGPYFNGVFPPTPPGDPSGWAVENAFPGLTFTDPMRLVEIPGAGELLVVGKVGRIWRFPHDPSATMAQRVEALDWTAATQTSDDQGFYSLSFHPDFGQPGLPGEHSVFVCYSRQGVPGVDDDDHSYWTVSRFDWLPASGTIDPSSESILISQYDPHRFHNGGATFFGNDGYLYVTVGDGGLGGDGLDNSQEIDLGFFGGILRIDVDYYPGKPGSHAIRRQPGENPAWPAELAKPQGWPASYSQGYGIPDDNPFLDPAGGVLEEFYAIGLRSPHSAHLDPITGEVWVADVGEANREELNLVPKGGNCQWAYIEGTRATSKTKPSPLIGTDVVPVHEYSHAEGASIIGGLRYRGAKWNDFLGGKVLFGDHVRGRIWSLELPQGGGTPVVTELFSAFHTGYKGGLCNFSTDSAGEIYMMDLAGTGNPNGRIMKLGVPEVSAEPPQFLSQTGVFDDLASLTPAAGVMPYDIPNALWSDNALKRRWIILPNDGAFDSPEEKIVFSEDEAWQFPAGTVFVKHFEAPLDASDPGQVKRLETRFLVCTSGGGKYGFTYKWNAEGTDAELLQSGLSEDYPFHAPGGTEQRTWTYPSRGDCLACHNDVAGQALGVRTAHFNSDAFYPATGRTANQLATLSSLGAFDVALTAAQLENFLEARPLDDETAPLEHRVRSYLDTNCSHCHQPGGQGAGFDARLSTPLDLQNLINGIPQRYEELGPEGRYIRPGNSSLSATFVRLSAVGNGDAMPPLAKNLAHAQGIARLQAYIDGLVPEEFASPPAPEARFVRLTSLTGRRRYAAVSEFTILDGEGVPISFESVVATADLEAGSSTAAAKANDGIATSGGNLWQTPSGPVSPDETKAPDHPHWLQLDLGSVREVGGFIYYPRVNSENGRIYDYQVECSVDGLTWSPLDAGTWPNSAEPYTFAPGFNKRAARCQIAGPASAPLGNFEVTIVFDMETDEFTASDLAVTGGMATGLRGSGYYYIARITPTSGLVTVQVPADAVSPEGKGSLASGIISVTATPDLTPPGQPGNLQAAATDSSVALSWDAPDDNVGVEAYEIRRDGTLVATTADTAFTDAGVASETSFSYVVVALDAALNPSPGAGVTAVTLADATPPSAPQDLSASPDFDAIGLAWSPVADNTVVGGYEVRRDGELIATLNSPDFVDSELPRDTPFSYSVVAFDAAGNRSEAAIVATATKGFADWLEDFGIAGQSTADSDRGGLDNLSEYHLGLDPTSALDDLTFKLTATLDGQNVRIALPPLVADGSFHLHASSSPAGLADPSNRILTLTREQIEFMTPTERGSYEFETPRSDQGFFILYFEPGTP